MSRAVRSGGDGDGGGRQAFRQGRGGDRRISGIGAASARLFAEAGARVVVGYNRGVDRANAVVAELAGCWPQGDAPAARGHRADQARSPPRSRRSSAAATSWSIPPASPAWCAHQRPRSARRRSDRPGADRQCARALRDDPRLRAAAEGVGRRGHRQHLVGRGAVAAPAARSSTAPRKPRSTR